MSESCDGNPICHQKIVGFFPFSSSTDLLLDKRCSPVLSSLWAIPFGSKRPGPRGSGPAHATDHDPSDISRRSPHASTMGSIPNCRSIQRAATGTRRLTVATANQYDHRAARLMEAQRVPQYCRVVDAASEIIRRLSLMSHSNENGQKLVRGFPSGREGTPRTSPSSSVLLQVSPAGHVSFPANRKGIPRSPTPPGLGHSSQRIAKKQQGGKEIPQHHHRPNPQLPLTLNLEPKWLRLE